MAKLEYERVPKERTVGPASVSSRGNKRPIADLIGEMEGEQPDLVASRGVSSAALRAGDLIRTMRKAAKLSQSEVADKLGISQARVSELEAGLGPQGPTWDVMERVAAVCGMGLGSVVIGATAPFYASKVVEGLVKLGLPSANVRYVELNGRSCLSFDLASDDRGSARESVVVGPLLASSA